jgi:hypothetical protein
MARHADNDFELMCAAVQYISDLGLREDFSRKYAQGIYPRDSSHDTQGG